MTQAGRDCSRLNPHPRRGAVAVLVALLLPVMLILSGLAINLAYLELSRTEMYVAADAAARAANREYLRLRNQPPARNRGRQVARLNTVAGVSATIPNNRFVFGTAVRPGMGSRYNFTAGNNNVNAVRVTLERTTSSPDGQLRTLLPNWNATQAIDATQIATATQADCDVVLIVDRSGSMAYGSNETATGAMPPAAAPPGWNWGSPVPNPSRWLDAVAAVNVFLTELQNSPCDEKVALVTYNTTVQVDSLFTSNYATIQPLLDVYSQSYQMGLTNIGQAIQDGVNLFGNSSARPWAARIIVMLTDGNATTGPDPISSAGVAASSKVQVYTVTFSSEADQGTMQQVASIGAGQSFHATNAASLQQAFQDIARNLPTLLIR